MGEKAIAYIEGWSTWGLAGMFALCVVAIVAIPITVHACLDGGYGRRPGLSPITGLLIVVAGFVGLWLSLNSLIRHIAGVNNMWTLFFVLACIAGVAAISVGFADGRLGVFAAMAFAVEFICIGVMELLTRVAASIPTSVGAVVAMILIAVLLFFAYATD